METGYRSGSRLGSRLAAIKGFLINPRLKDQRHESLFQNNVLPSIVSISINGSTPVTVM